MSRLLVDGTNLFAAGSTKVFLSTNNGEGWSERNSGLNNVGVQTLALAGPYLLAGTNAGIYFSTNQGKSWSPKINSVKYSCTCIATLGSVIFASTNNGHGIILSTDSGLNWSEVNNGMTATAVTSLVVIDKTILASAVGSDGGIFRSTDSGSSWHAVDNGLPQY
ncbi:MAG: WD40/YVTN/BNR-like repeat-containing protein, partial [Rhabdochlamydiaceae bacterium]